MNAGTDIIDRHVSNEASAWSSAFEFADRAPEFARLLSLLTVDIADIYTSQLQHTVNLCGAMQGGRVKMLKRDASEASFTDLLRLLAIIVTHSRPGSGQGRSPGLPGVLPARGGRKDPALHAAPASGSDLGS